MKGRDAKRARVVIVAGAVLLAIPSTVWGVDYYVRPDGSDVACNGLFDTPCGPPCQQPPSGKLDCALATPTECGETVGAGDTCHVGAGSYSRMDLIDVNGEPGRWVTLTGPQSGPPAVIEGQAGSNTVQLLGCRYLILKNFKIDSRGHQRATGIDAQEWSQGGQIAYPHHIQLLDNLVVGVGGVNPSQSGDNEDQQTVGISTKSAAWNFVIRGNTIIEPGTGLYLGNSDGTDPFIAGIVEGNYVENPIGYAMQIKPQNPYDDLAGINEAPLGPNVTIIRDNVLIKDGRPSPNGSRPNLLVGPFPEPGDGTRGVSDLYEIYGNFIYNNPRESLIQASGRVAIHDNVLVDGNDGGTAIYLKDQTWREWIDGVPISRTGRLRVAYIYNNTIYRGGRGIHAANQIRDDHQVLGNLIFAPTPTAGFITDQRDNISDSAGNAASYVANPSSILGQMDFYPLPGPPGQPGPCQGVDLGYPPSFLQHVAYGFDFNGTAKDAFAGVPDSFTFRGAYAGEAVNPGWQLDSGLKDADPGPGGEPPAPPGNLRAR